MHDILGRTVADKVTNFKGIVMGRVEYLSGCNQLLVQPPVGADGAFKTSEWFDEQRCAPAGDQKITLDNGNSPGFDKAPPRR